MGRNIHADLIHEWAETGCEIQYKLPDGISWCDARDPQWSQKLMYRKKPEIIKYKRYIMTDSGCDHKYIKCMSDKDTVMPDNLRSFVGWIDEDWQIVEV